MTASFTSIAIGAGSTFLNTLLSTTLQNVQKGLIQPPANLDPFNFSATTSSFPDAADLAMKLKEQSPDTITVCGGVHVSALEGKLLEDYPAFDYLIAGEGEITMAQLCAGDSPAGIKGLIWRRKEDVITNEPQPLIADLDSLPFPAYEKLQGFPYDYHLPLFRYIQTFHQQKR